MAVGDVDAERRRTAAALPSRNDEFLKVKIEGLRDCAELLVVTLMAEREKHIIGRRTLPEMDVASVGCAIQNMWLAARAEGVGLGWVPAFYPRPMFEETGWGKRLDLTQVLYENRWPESSAPTPTAY